MGSQSKMPTQAGHEGKMHVFVRIWLYSDPDQLDQVNRLVADYIDDRTSWIDNKATWTAEPVLRSLQDSMVPESEIPKAAREAAVSVPPPKGNMVFSSVLIKLQTEGIANPTKRKSKGEMFEDLLDFVNNVMRNGGREIGDISKVDGQQAICWMVWDPTITPDTSKTQTEVRSCSVWVLPSPNKLPERPAEKIEQVLHSLVSIKQRNAEKLYRDPLGGRAVLKTVEDLLYQQKIRYDTLRNKLNALKDPALDEEATRKAVDEYIKTLEEVDTALSTLVYIYDQNVGKVSTSKSKDMVKKPWWAALRQLLIRLFMRHGEFGSLAIDDKTLEELKDNARKELRGMQRVAPIIAAHARLRYSRNWQELKRVCELATTGVEKLGFPTKLGIDVYFLPNKDYQIGALDRVNKFYETSHDKVLVQLEALDKCVGKKFADEGTKIFRDRKDRDYIDPESAVFYNGKGGAKKARFTRLVKKFGIRKEKELKETKGFDSDSDSMSDKSIVKEEQCEKA